MAILRFNSNSTALTFGSFGQAKEQRCPPFCIAKKGGAKNASAKIRLLIFTDHFALHIETHFLRSRKLKQSICNALRSLKIYAIVFQGAILNFGHS